VQKLLLAEIAPQLEQLQQVQFIDTLRVFDQKSQRNLLDVVKPKVEMRLKGHLSKIKHLITRWIQMEQWLPVVSSSAIKNSESAVHLVYYLNLILENLHQTLGSEIFKKWADLFYQLIREAVQEYAD